MTVPCVYGVHAGGTFLQKAVGKASRGSTDIQSRKILDIGIFPITIVPSCIESSVIYSPLYEQYLFVSALNTIVGITRALYVS